MRRIRQIHHCDQKCRKRRMQIRGRERRCRKAEWLTVFPVGRILLTVRFAYILPVTWRTSAKKRKTGKDRLVTSVSTTVFNHLTCIFRTPFRFYDPLLLIPSIFSLLPSPFFLPSFLVSLLELDSIDPGLPSVGRKRQVGDHVRVPKNRA